MYTHFWIYIQSTWPFLARTIIFWVYPALLRHLVISVPLFYESAAFDAFLFRNVFGTLISNFALLFALLFAPTSPSYGVDKLNGLLGSKLFDWLPQYMLFRDILWAEKLVLTPTETAVLILVPAAFILGTALISYHLFRRAELK